MNETPPPSEERPPDPPDDRKSGSDLIAGENPGDDVLPMGRTARRVATVIGLLFIALILGFLIAFIATHTERIEGGMMGWAAPHHLDVGVA